MIKNDPVYSKTFNWQENVTPVCVVQTQSYFPGARVFDRVSSLFRYKHKFSFIGNCFYNNRYNVSVYMTSCRSPKGWVTMLHFLKIQTVSGIYSDEGAGRIPSWLKLVISQIQK